MVRSAVPLAFLHLLHAALFALRSSGSRRLLAIRGAGCVAAGSLAPCCLPALALLSI
jgi:hypothetical protein